MSNREAAIKEAVAKAISKAEERHRIEKELFERRMESECRERFEE